MGGRNLIDYLIELVLVGTADQLNTEHFNKTTRRERDDTRLCAAGNKHPGNFQLHMNARIVGDNELQIAFMCDGVHKNYPGFVFLVMLFQTLQEIVFLSVEQRWHKLLDELQNTQNVVILYECTAK